MSKLIKIDDLFLRDHSYLSENDECYFFFPYTAGATFSHSEGNALINNFKKDIEKFGQRREVMYHKDRAIRQVASLLTAELPTLVDLSECALVPIPPSKTKKHQFYDGRMTTALTMVAANLGADVRELIVLNDDMEAVHLASRRPRPQELQDNMHLHRGLKGDLPETIILFDDVVTTGAHFVACRDLILEEFPDTNIIGVFVARRVPENPFADFTDA